MNLPRLLSCLTATLSSGLIATQAQAQIYRPDAEGYPCDARPRLAVVQDDHGYSIRPRPSQTVTAPAPVLSTIAIGTSYKIDTRIVARSPLSSLEVSHAPRR